MYEQRSWSDKWVALENCKSGEILLSAIYKPTLPSRSSSTRYWFLYFSIHVFTVHLYNLFESDGNCIKAVTNLLMSCYADRLVLCWSVESWPSLSSRPGEGLKENCWVECTRWNKGPPLHNALRPWISQIHFKEPREGRTLGQGRPVRPSYPWRPES